MLGRAGHSFTRPLLRLLCASAVVCALGQLPAAPAFAAPVGGTLTAASGSVIVKEQVVLNGSLPPAQSRPITLQRRMGTGSWTNAGSTTSRSNGAFSFTVTMPAKVNTTILYRVLAAQARLGGVTYPAVQTPDVTLRTVAQTAVLTSPATVLVGSTYSLTAAFSPARPGRPVVFQRSSGAAWINVSTTTQGAGGAASTNVQATSAGSTIYRVLTKKSLGAPQIVSATKTVTASTQDTTAPPIPTGLTATAGDGSVALAWTAVSAADLSGYRIYQGNSAIGPWTQVGQTNTATANVGDLINDTSYWFAVTSVDQTGNESNRSESISATPDDNVQPPTPTGLQAIGGDGSVMLSWDAVSDPGLVGYQVFRSSTSTGDSWTMLNFTPTTDTHFNDTTAVNGTAYWYVVASRDEAGNLSDFPTSVPATPHEAVQPTLVAGGQHTCRIKLGGSLWCSGTNTYGELGNGTTSNLAVPTPTQVGTDTDWASVSPGSFSTCALKTDGTAWCWGLNQFGTLGDGTTTDRLVPTQLGTASDWATISVGTYHACGLKTDGTVWCWGSNNAGQVGDNTTTNRTSPVQIGSGWATVHAGAATTCGVKTDGTGWCWGANTNGKLGDGTATNRKVPTQVGTDTEWLRITTSVLHTCGVKTDGTIWCWGEATNGELGNGTPDFNEYHSPTQVGTDTGWANVVVGLNFSCGIKADGTIWCWGFNAYGSLGDGTTTTRFNPVQVGTDTNWRSLTAGSYDICAVKTDGSLWYWGDNFWGGLGDGTTTQHNSPVLVA